MPRRASLLLLFPLAAFLGGCGSPPKPDLSPAIDMRAQPAATNAQIARGYNARVEHLERFWSRIIVVVQRRAEDGGTTSDQAEGHIQVVRPWRVAVQITKLGETVFFLGSDERRYWWFDLREERTASLGSHAKASPQNAARMGLPVHPLDLVELLGITPLDMNAAQVGQTTDGRFLVVATPGRWGRRRLFLDPATYEPRRVELLDGMGAIAIAATLDQFLSVPVAGDTTAAARTPGRVVAWLPAQETRITLALSEPENKPINAATFDFTALSKAFRVQRQINMDDQPHAGARR